jgi:uncharacterized protein YndB with AHSA1/START domain
MSLATVEDFGTLIGPRTLEIQRLLPGPMERIWDYLTKSELRRQWLASGDMELKVGSEFQLTWRNSELGVELGTRPADKSEEHTETMRVTACEPPRKLAYTFGSHGEVSYELKPAGDKVLLTLIHKNAPNRGTLLGVSAGWHAHLDVLVAVVSGTKAKPFWDNLAAIKPVYDKRIPADS